MRVREDYTGKLLKRSLCGEVDEFLKYKEQKLKKQLQGVDDLEESPNQKRAKRRAPKGVNNISLNMSSIGTAQIFDERRRNIEQASSPLSN